MAWLLCSSGFYLCLNFYYLFYKTVISSLLKLDLSVNSLWFRRSHFIQSFISLWYFYLCDVLYSNDYVSTLLKQNTCYPHLVVEEKKHWLLKKYAVLFVRCPREAVTDKDSFLKICFSVEIFSKHTFKT